MGGGGVGGKSSLAASDTVCDSIISQRERERERAHSLEDDIKVWGEKNKKTTVLVIDGGRLQLSGLCEA